MMRKNTFLNLSLILIFFLTFSTGLYGQEEKSNELKEQLKSTAPARNNNLELPKKEKSIDNSSKFENSGNRSQSGMDKAPRQKANSSSQENTTKEVSPKPAMNQNSRPSNTSPSKSAPSRPASSSSRPAPSPSRPAGGVGAGYMGPSSPSHFNQGPVQRPANPKPGTQHAATRPNNHSSAPSHAAPRPGASSPGQSSASRPGYPYRPDASRPHHNFSNPGYHPPHPTGGYWGAPPVNIYRPQFYTPTPPPPRPYINYGVPAISSILGLSFGTFIDTGINSLFNSGYNVLGYDKNIVYVGNVNHLGYIWPETMVYFSDGLMSDMQFQYWSLKPDNKMFDKLYKSLVKTYGAPINSGANGPVTVANWWAGGGTGFITLQYGPGTNESGQPSYYTTLTYSDNR